MRAFFLTLLLLFSCTKYAEVSKDSVGIQVRDVSMSITDLHEVSWTIGKNKEGKVTQSIDFIVDVPRLKEADIDFLEKESGANAWIIRVIQQKGSTQQDLGSLYTHLRPKQVTRGIGGGAALRVSVRIYYAAAYASERFRHFTCPAFGHNKRITSMEIEGRNDPVHISFAAPAPYGERSQLVQLAPSAFNGGNSLKGHYYLEIAPYDSKRKMILGRFTKVPQYIEIKEEIPQGVESCQGVRPEQE